MKLDVQCDRQQGKGEDSRSRREDAEPWLVALYGSIVVTYEAEVATYGVPHKGTPQVHPTATRT